MQDENFFSANYYVFSDMDCPFFFNVSKRKYSWITFFKFSVHAYLFYKTTVEAEARKSNVSSVGADKLRVLLIVLPTFNGSFSVC
ncbi:hypothetical protein OC195_18670 [Priestia flexa]|nr:hypothetical protein OC195_18670 [Priestia flexa]